MRQYALERSPGDDVTQLGVGVGEQMRIRQVQDPNCIALAFPGRFVQKPS